MTSNTRINITLDNNNIDASIEALIKFCSGFAKDKQIDKEQLFDDVLGDKEFIEFIAETLHGFSVYDLHHCWRHHCMKAQSTGGAK